MDLVLGRGVPYTILRAEGQAPSAEEAVCRQQQVQCQLLAAVYSLSSVEPQASMFNVTGDFGAKILITSYCSLNG